MTMTTLITTAQEMRRQREAKQDDRERELSEMREAGKAADLADLKALLGNVAGEAEITLYSLRTGSGGEVYDTGYDIRPAVWQGLAGFVASRWSAADQWKFGYYTSYGSHCVVELGLAPVSVWTQPKVLQMIADLQVVYEQERDSIVTAARDSLGMAQDWDTFADAQSALMRCAPEREAEWQALAAAARGRIAERRAGVSAYVQALAEWRYRYELALTENRATVAGAQRALDKEFTRHQVGLAVFWTTEDDDTYIGGVYPARVSIWSLDKEPDADGYWRVLEDGCVVQRRLIKPLWVGTAVTEKLSEAGEGPWRRARYVHDAGQSVYYLPWDETEMHRLLDKTITPLPAEPEPPAVFADGLTTAERERIAEATRGMAHVGIPF